MKFFFSRFFGGHVRVENKINEHLKMRYFYKYFSVSQQTDVENEANNVGVHITHTHTHTRKRQRRHESFDNAAPSVTRPTTKDPACHNPQLSAKSICSPNKEGLKSPGWGKSLQGALIAGFLKATQEKIIILSVARLWG